MRKIKLYRKRPPRDEDVHDIIDWVCNSLGLVSGRDTDRTAAAIFKRIVRAQRTGETITTSDLAQELSVTRGTINHHLREFIKAGLLTREKQELRLRSNTLKRTIREVKRDAERIFDDLIRRAEELDERLS